MKKNKKMRIAVDVNCWISSLLSLEFRIRLDVIFGSEYHLIASEKLFYELENAIRKPYLAERIARAAYEKLVSKLWTVAELVDVHSVVDVCRDPKDNYLLALAKDGNADYLITGDDDLCVLKQFGKTKIVKWNEFEALLQEMKNH